MDPMLVTMREIPPNPENGELFLPSDVVKEINSGTVQLKVKPNQLCYASIVAGFTRVKVQTVGSAHESSTHVLPNIQGSEKKTQQVLPMQEKYTWAQIVKGEAPSLKNELNGSHSLLPQSRMSSMEPQRAGEKAVPLNKQVIQPNFAKKMNGKK